MLICNSTTCFSATLSTHTLGSGGLRSQPTSSVARVQRRLLRRWRNSPDSRRWGLAVSLRRAAVPLACNRGFVCRSGVQAARRVLQQYFACAVPHAGNNIGSAGAAALAPALRRLTGVMELNLNGA